MKYSAVRTFLYSWRVKGAAFNNFLFSNPRANDDSALKETDLLKRHRSRNRLLGVWSLLFVLKFSLYVKSLTVLSQHLSFDADSGVRRLDVHIHQGRVHVSEGGDAPGQFTLK